MTHRILILPGDGIGPEIMDQAERVLEVLGRCHGLEFSAEYGVVGGAAVDKTGDPLPDVTLDQARSADAILFGSIGGEKWDNLERHLRPESGLLRLRSELGLFANLRPAILNRYLASASSLKPELVADLDIMIVRELTGGIYFGQPREISTRNGVRTGINSMVYDENEISAIARVAGRIARQRNRRLCSVDKANVLEVSQLWREITTDVISTEFPEVELSHMYVDNACMQMVRDPRQFDVVVTGNLFGDVLSDIAAMLTGSIGMLPSASLDINNKGMYEPVHGSAPDIAGKNLANPIAVILSLAMMLRYSLGVPKLADKIQAAVDAALGKGLRTADIVQPGTEPACSTGEMGDAIVGYLEQSA